MVRLVFRPYTQLWRLICTLKALRASTRVSPGFTLVMHSSPSFGSRRRCSHSNHSPADQGRPMVHFTKNCAKIPSVTFITHQGLPPKYSHIRQTPWSVFQDGIMNAIYSASRPYCKGFWEISASKAEQARLFSDTKDSLALHTTIQASTHRVATKFTTPRAHAELPTRTQWTHKRGTGRNAGTTSKHSFLANHFRYF